MTNKQIREVLKELSPKPGYIKSLSRIQFEELVEDTIDIDISEQTESNANRLKSLLKSCTDEQCEALLTAIRAV